MQQGQAADVGAVAVAAGLYPAQEGHGLFHGCIGGLELLLFFPSQRARGEQVQGFSQGHGGNLVDGARGSLKGDGGKP